VVLAFALLWWGPAGVIFSGHNAGSRGANSESGSVVDPVAPDGSPGGAGMTLSVPGGRTASAPQTAEGPALDPVALSRKKQVLGIWEQFNQGRRVLTVREDGTATMKVKLEGAWSYVVGENLEFEINWNIEGSRLLFHTTGGKPEGSLKLITSMYGTERNHQIEKLTDDEMILVDEKDKSRDHWKRIEAP